MTIAWKLCFWKAGIWKPPDLSEACWTNKFVIFWMFRITQWLIMYHNSNKELSNVNSTRSQRFIFNPYSLTKHQWKEIWYVLPKIKISSDWRVTEQFPHSFQNFIQLPHNCFNHSLEGSIHSMESNMNQCS